MFLKHTHLEMPECAQAHLQKHRISQLFREDPAPPHSGRTARTDAGESGRKGLEGGEGKEEQQGEYAEEVLSQT